MWFAIGMFTSGFIAGFVIGLIVMRYWANWAFMEMLKR